MPKLHNYSCPVILKLQRVNQMMKSLLWFIPPPNVTGSLHLGHALTAAGGMECWVMLRCMFLVSTPFILFALFWYGVDRRYIYIGDPNDDNSVGRSDTLC